MDEAAKEGAVSRNFALYTLLVAGKDDVT